MQGDVHVHVRKAEKKRAFGRRLPADELDRLDEVAVGQRHLVGVGLEDFIVVQQRKRRELMPCVPGMGRLHVVAVGEPEIAVEAVISGEKRRLVAQVPLADQRRGISGPAKGVSDCRFVGMEPDRIAGKQHRAPVMALFEADAPRVATGHKRGAGRGADRGGGVEIGEARTFRGEPVEPRGVV